MPSPHRRHHHHCDSSSMPTPSSDGPSTSSSIHSEANGAWDSAWDSMAAVMVLALAAMPPEAAVAAEEGLRYNNEGGQGLIKGLSGIFYVGLLIYFLVRTLNKSARRAREEVRFQ